MSKTSSISWRRSQETDFVASVWWVSVLSLMDLEAGWSNCTARYIKCIHNLRDVQSEKDASEYLSEYLTDPAEYPWRSNYIIYLSFSQNPVLHVFLQDHLLSSSCMTLLVGFMQCHWLLVLALGLRPRQIYIRSSPNNKVGLGVISLRLSR